MKLGIAFLHILEDTRISASELVNALLDITYHKSVGLARYSLEYFILQAVYVLVLVNIYRAIEARLLLRNVGLLAVLPKALVGKALDV